MIHQDIFTDQRNIVVNQVVAVIVLLVVALDLLNIILIYKFWRISLTTSLVTGVWLGVDTSEGSWLNLEAVLASGNHHFFVLHFRSDDDTVLVIQVRMTHDEYLVISVVLNQFEVVSSLPVVLLLEDTDILEVLLGHLDHASFVLQMEGSIGHHEMIQNLNLLKLLGQIFREFSFTNTVAVYTE